MPDGSAAPATYSTGTTNTLTLTPVCGSAQKNVSATVTANGNIYNSSSSIVTISQPTISISGNASFCSGTSTYSITGLPCNATLAWNVSPTGIVTPNTSTSTTPTFTKVTNGNITLSATVTSCGVTQPPLTKPIHVGAYTTSDYTLSGNSGSNYWCPNQTLTFSVNSSGSSYSWSIPSGWTIISNSGSYIQVKTPTSPNPPTGTLSVSFLEPCGSLLQLNRYLAYNSSVCTPTFPYTISPNPASSTITIACTSLQTYCNISSVQITDIYGTVKSSQSWNYTNQQVQMPVSFLTNGTYIARVYDGSQWYSGQFQVQH